MSHVIYIVVIGANSWPYFVKRVKRQGEFNSTEYYFQHNGQMEFFRDGKRVVFSLDALSDFLEFLILSNKKVFLVLNSPSGDALGSKSFHDGSRFGQVRYKPNANLLQSEFEKGYGPIKEELKSIGMRTGAILSITRKICVLKDSVLQSCRMAPRFIKTEDIFLALFSKNYGNFIDSTVELTLPSSSRH